MINHVFFTNKKTTPQKWEHQSTKKKLWKKIFPVSFDLGCAESLNSSMQKRERDGKVKSGESNPTRICHCHCARLKRSRSPSPHLRSDRSDRSAQRKRGRGRRAAGQFPARPSHHRRCRSAVASPRPGCSLTAASPNIFPKDGPPFHRHECGLVMKCQISLPPQL